MIFEGGLGHKRENNFYMLYTGNTFNIFFPRNTKPGKFKCTWKLPEIAPNHVL
jgi:hypothetical protein